MENIDAQHISDMDVCSLYAWSPLIVSQSEICKLLKQRRCGKSHRAKINAKYRLKLLKKAWVRYDTKENEAWSKKHISKVGLYPKGLPLDASFNFPKYKELKNSLYFQGIKNE